MMAARQVEVAVTAHYAPQHSESTQQRYVFVYEVTIHNRGELAVQLLRRHWLIWDSDGSVREVRGEGVVGEQPQLAPGTAFRYASSAVLTTPVGAMQGSYAMQASDGTDFTAPIRPFTLAMPGILN